MLTITPFQPHHQQGVVELILPIQQREFGIDIDIARQPDLLDIPGFYRQGAGNFWVALDGEQVVGSISVLDIGAGQGALRKMFVKASHRGAGQGVAGQLLDTLLLWCAQQGLGDIYLGTTAQFLAAHRFYEKHGFSLVAKEALPARFPVMAVDSRFYRRQLPAS